MDELLHWSCMGGDAYYDLDRSCSTNRSPKSNGASGFTSVVKKRVKGNSLQLQVPRIDFANPDSSLSLVVSPAWMAFSAYRDRVADSNALLSASSSKIESALDHSPSVSESSQRLTHLDLQVLHWRANPGLILLCASDWVSHSATCAWFADIACERQGLSRLEVAAQGFSACSVSHSACLPSRVTVLSFDLDCHGYQYSAQFRLLLIAIDCRFKIYWCGFSVHWSSSWRSHFECAHGQSSSSKFPVFLDYRRL